jgi:hyperosmotically inducible periplasmic protein
MKKTFLSAALAILLVAGYSCKGKDKNTTTDTTTNTTTAPNPAPTAPVVVSGDDSLRQGVTDATKDIQGLQTRVENGVIYLSGTISREDNMRITPTLNSLRPQSINRDNLTVK